MKGVDSKSLIDSTVIAKKPRKEYRNLTQSLRYIGNNASEADESSTSESEDEVPVVPGHKPYSATAKPTNNREKNTLAKSTEPASDVMVFSTSITKGIQPSRFNERYTNGDAAFTRFGGARARYMSAYVLPRMVEAKPGTVIIQAGGNDLSHNKSEKFQPLVTIANHVIDAGLACRNKGAKNIMIGGVTTRKDTYQAKRCTELNTILRDLCIINEFSFIDNSLIKEEHLYDGVHLKDSGSRILAENYLKALFKLHYD